MKHLTIRSTEKQVRSSSPGLFLVQSAQEVVMHLTLRGDICGLPDGHRGFHRTVEGQRREVERKQIRAWKRRADPVLYLAELAYNRVRYRRRTG